MVHANHALTVALGGDVMTGRGIDQVLAHHVNPALYEPWVRDAREYVRLAEAAHGAIAAPVEPAYVFGAAIAAIQHRRPDLWLVNLETAITREGQPWPGKGIHYRMHPENIGCLTAAGIGCCALANNHVLDWGATGLRHTLQALSAAGIGFAGAGTDEVAARAPAVFPIDSQSRWLVLSRATPDAGVPTSWAAAAGRVGVALLPRLDEAAVNDVVSTARRYRRPGDRVILSIHWGSNWGLEVPPSHRWFAHRLIESGVVDVVHGHSSHHPRPMEVYQGRLILYGCGDLVNDYEGIGAQGGFDPSAVCLYFARIDRKSGASDQLEILPLQLRRFRLGDAPSAIRRGLRQMLDQACMPFGSRVDQLSDGRWVLRW